MVFFGEGAAPGEPCWVPAPPPVCVGRDRVEGAGALQPQLVQMHGTGEQTPRQVDVGEDQMGRVHPPQRGHPHPGVRRAGKSLLVHRLSVGECEGVGLRGDREGVFENRVGEVHRGVAQPHLSR